MSLLDIHANITFSTIAPILGMEPVDRYTVAARCPYCGAHAWAIYQDSKNLEEWHYCSQCKATGSVIAMAAERLEMSEIEAIHYLGERLERNIPHKSIQAYCRSQSYLKRYADFWEQVQYSLRNPTDEQRSFMKYLGWQPRSSMSVERLLEGPGRLFAVAEPRLIRKHLDNINKIKLKETQVVVPFYNKPAQIGGFVCISPKREVVIHHGPDPHELGFAGFQFLDQLHSDSLVVTSMLRNMVQLQMRHFSSNKNPLPLFSWRPPSLTTRQKQWSTLHGRKIVLWEREPTAIVLHQAMMSNANLTFVGPETRRQKPREVKGARWKKWLSHDPAIDIWRRIVRSSRPYEQALRNWARHATANEKVKLLQDAEQYDEHTALLVRSAINRKLSVQVGRTVRVGTHPTRPKGAGNQTVIIERNGKWYSTSGKVRFPGILRVTHVVARPTGDSDYVGYMVIDGKRIEFQVPTRKANMKWLKEHALANGAFVQEDKYINQFRNHVSEKFDPFEAATRFELPETVKGLDRIGWDGAGFQFRNSRLLNGVFRQNPEFKLPVDAPGPKQQFCRMREEVKTALQRDGKEMEVVWALAIALCAQVTSPVVDLHPFGIWVRRGKYDPFLQALYTRFEIHKGSYTDWKHKWPRRLDRWDLAVVKDESGFFVTHYRTEPNVPELLTVEADNKDLQPRMVTHSADKIVMNYLKHFSTLKPEFPGNWENWIQFTAEQFNRVFDFVDTDAYRNAPNLIKVV